MNEKEKPNIRKWIEILDSRSRKDDRRKLCKRISSFVDVSSRRRVSVNLYKINSYSNGDDNIIVPGKVLSTGAMDHKINISALEFSAKAIELLKGSNCKIVDIEEMLAKKKIKIIT